MTVGIERSSARIQPSTFAYHDLYEWYEALLGELRITPASGSVSVPWNRIVIGIAEPGQRSEVERAARALGIPGEAVSIEQAPELHLLTGSVNSVHRPTPSGVHIEFLNA